ncbi:TonB-dependent siderophore receptor [Cupriavidus agavae]|uniref:Iron complex outermembrane receptor protein n=1 Tax=Cupriavidus agavae TaxID=1001822 RepID=A0A4Q7RXC2_9BURK|nr:TonB-dependent siderophore receptor [Cupriavidus agavae]RZT36872.1 iron complex outermembrane receptor protein [Cupriavidus agavae]
METTLHSAAAAAPFRRHRLDTALHGALFSLALSAGTAHAQQPQPQAAGDVATLPTVTVTSSADAHDDYRADNASLGAFGNKSLLDTPYSVDVVTRDLMDNQQAASLVQALKNDASVSVTSNNIAGLSSQIAVRGITLDLLNGRKIDGLNIFGWSGDLPLEHFEQVQLLKGAGGFLYGFAQPGGIVNFISKRPTNVPVRSVFSSVTNGGTFLLGGDLGGRFGPDDRFGYRTTIVGEEGDSYVKDGGHVKRGSASLALDWRILPNLVWSVDGLAMDRVVKGSSGWGLFPNASGEPGDFTAAEPPAAIRGSKRIYSPFTSYETRSKVYGTSLDWGFAENWNARVQYRGSILDRIYLNGSIYANAAGNYTEEQYGGTDRFKTDDVIGMVTGKVKTGFITHDLTFGLQYGRIRSYYSGVSNYAVLGSGNLANPGSFDNPGLSAEPADTLGSYTAQRALFISDTLHLGEHWDVVVGVRRNNIKDTVNDYDKSATTPTAALIFKPLPWLSTYGSYVESLEQGSTAPLTAANAREVFGPIKSKQMELGVKAQRERWSANAALFRIKRGLTYTTSSNEFTQDGEARYDGLELGGNMRVTPLWMVSASVLFLNAKNETASEAIAGKRVDGTPRQQASIYTEYRLWDTGFTLSAGMQYYGARPIDPANTVSLPSYTLFDAGVRYTTRVAGKRTTVRFNVDNLTNKAYWLTSASYLTQGAPRVFKLGAQIDF